jgi:hypothetical protein
MTDQPHPSVPAGSGRSVRLPGLTTQFKVGGEQTGGAFSIVEHRIEPGTPAPRRRGSSRSSRRRGSNGSSRSRPRSTPLERLILRRCWSAPSRTG